MERQQAELLLFGVWAASGVLVAMFYWKGPLELKRRWHPRIIVGSAAAFGAFVWFTSPSLPERAVLVPALLGIAYLNLKMIKFCSACGATLIQSPPWSPIRFCSKCGVAIGEHAA